eukprot:403355556
MSAILEINTNGDLIFGGSLYNQPFLAKQVNREYYYLISWMKVFESLDTKFVKYGTVYSVDSLAYKSYNDNELIAAAIRVLDGTGQMNIFIGTFDGDGNYKQGGIFFGQNVPNNKVRQMITFNGDQELIWAYQLGSNGRISKFSRDLKTIYYTLTFPTDQWTYNVKSLFPSAHSFVYFGGQKVSASGNDLLFGCFQTNGDNPGNPFIANLVMTCPQGNCFSHSVNMIYEQQINNQREVFGCISNEHIRGTEFHAWGFVALNLDDTSKQSAYAQYANTHDIEYYCSGIHMRQNSSLAVYVTKINKNTLARGLMYLNSNYDQLYSSGGKEYNERIYLAGYYRNMSNMYTKAFMTQYGDDTQIQDSIGNFREEGDLEGFHSLIGTFYYDIKFVLLHNKTQTSDLSGFTLDYIINETGYDARNNSYTLTDFTPILSYTEETPLIIFTNPNKTYECFIGIECIVTVANITIQNCEEGIDSKIRINVGNQISDMEQSTLNQYKVDSMYSMPFLLTFTYTPTGLAFNGLDYTDYKLTIHSFFDYPVDTVLGVFQDPQFYLRIWDECTYHRNDIYKDPNLPNATFVIGESMSYFKLPYIVTYISGCNTVSDIQVSYENQLQKPGMISTYHEKTTNKIYLLIYTNKKSYVGNYKVQVQTFFDVITSSSQRVNLAPLFETSLKNQTINVGASVIYNLPKTIDQNGNNIEIEYHIGVTQIFTDTIDNKGKGMMTFNPKKEHVGEYAVEIWLKDDHPTNPLITKYKFGIIVNGAGNDSIGFENITDEERFASQTEFIGYIRAKIKRIDYKGEMLILFDTNIKCPPNYIERLNKSLEVNLVQNAMKALMGSLGDGSSASVQAFMGGNFILSIFMQAIYLKFKY